MSPDHIDQLLDAYLLGEISLEQTAQLQEALKSDAAARRRFVLRIFIETGLHHLARTEPATLTPSPHPAPQAAPPSPAATRRASGSRRRLALAATILLAIGAAAALYFTRRDPGDLARVASGTVLVDGHSRDRIAQGSTLSVTGSTPAVIHLPDGSIATLDPATQLTLGGRADGARQVLHLTVGGGQFQVPRGGGQFRIDTPAGSVTVLGTQFTTVLRSPRSLFVAVTDGSVRFDRDGNAVTLAAGQSATFGPDPDRPPTRPAAPAPVETGWISSVDPAAARFVLSGRNESQTTFNVPSKPDDREADIFLDGKKTSFQAAIQPGRKATVTSLKRGDDLWVSKVEVTSEAK